MENVHLMHVLQPLTDLAYEEHRVQLCQVVVLIDDAVKQLPSFHTARKKKNFFNYFTLTDEKTHSKPRCIAGTKTYYSMTRMMS